MFFIELAPTFLGAFIHKITQIVVIVGKAVWQREIRKNRTVFNGICLNFRQHFEGVGERFGNVSKYVVHLLLCLHPFLFRIEHSVWFIQGTASRHTYKTVVGLGIFLINEMHIIGTHQLHSFLGCKFYEMVVNLHLQRIHIVVGSLHSCLVAL